MSPTRLSLMDELDCVIQQENTHAFRLLLQQSEIPYRVAIFKAIECGSYLFFDMVKRYHPDPNPDIELECLHASFRGHLNIYETIFYNRDMEEFNPYIENMYLMHGRLDKVNLMEINVHDLISPNTIPVSVCDRLIQRAPKNACLMTGVLLAYCIHNSDHYWKLLDNEYVWIMEKMFEYAAFHENESLVLFLLGHFKRYKKYTTYEYTNRTRCLQKERIVLNDGDGNLLMYDHYLTKPDGKPLNVKGDTKYTVHPMNLCLTADMFEWPYAKDKVEEDVYFEQVIDQVKQLLDKHLFVQLY